MRTNNKSSPLWRRVVATFMLATMLMSSMAVTAIAAPNGATVVDLTVAGGGSGQDSSVCVLHSSYDTDGHFLVCDTHTGSGTFNGKVHTNGRVDYKEHNIQYFGEPPTCNVLTPVGYWYCADGCGYQKSGRLEHQSEDVWRESGNARHYKVCSVCKVCWTVDGFHVINGIPVNEMEDHTIYGKSVCDICGLEVDLSNHCAEPAWDTGVSPCPICGDKRPFLQAMWLEKNTMDLVSNDSDYVDFRIYGSADRMSLLTGTTGFAWVYYPSDTADIFDIGEPVQIGSGVDAAGNTYRDYRITLSYKDSTVATAGIGQQTFALHYSFGSSTANATAGGVAEAAKWSPANAWGVTPNLYLLRTFSMSGGICEPVGTPVVTYDKQVGGYAQNVTIKTTWYGKRAGSAEVALFDQNGNQVTEWAAAAPSGGAWEYTSVISPNVNLSTAQTYTVRCKNYLGGYGSVNCVIQPTDMAGPNLVSDTDLTAEWAKTKAYTAKGQDAGVGSVELSFDGDADYQMGNNIGNGTYSRDYVFTGDVYSEQSHTFYMRDALGNVGTGSIRVNRLDNTAPTVTDAVSSLDSTGHRAKLNVTYNDAHPTLGEGSGVAELAVSTSNNASSLNWQPKDEAMYVDKAGKYYVFAKDAAGNVSSNYAVDVTINNYVVNTEFVSGTEGRDLPAEVRELLPLDQTGLSIGQSVNTPMAIGKTVVEHHEALELGEWKLVSWDKNSITVNGDGQHFIGTWDFKPYTAKVSYTYVSGTEGRELPAGIVAASATVHNVGDVVKAPDVVGSTYRETTKEGLCLGTWTMMVWDKDSSIVPNAGVTFTGTWEFIPATSTVRYRYESGTEGRTLPAEIVAASDAIYNVGTVVKAPDVVGSTYKETTKDGLFLGTWTMTGWDKESTVVPNKDVVFIGKWVFKPKAANVSYTYISGTEGYELPAGIVAPSDATYDVGSAVTAPDVKGNTYKETTKEGLFLGTWTMTGWDKDSAIVSNAGVSFTGTWEFVPATSTVHYRYESGTEGRALPSEIAAPSDVVYNVGTAVNAPDVKGSTYKETTEDGLFLGTWTMTGWDKDSVVVPNEEVVFVGKWVFKPETATVSYKFISGTEDRALPASLQPPAPSTYNVGDGVMPSVPKTVHAEKYESLTLGTWTLTGWDKNSAVVSNKGVTFTATWEFVPATSTVHYRYESGTAGRELPAGIVPADAAVYNVGSVAKAPDVLGSTYKETSEDGLFLGTWTMTGWDKDSAIVPNEEIVFTGKWEFKHETASVSYRFTSGTEGRELPASLQPPVSSTYNVGDDVTPSVPETVHAEKYESMTLGTWTLMGWDKASAIVPNAGVTFTATWEFVPATSTVRYRYESGTEGRELPAEIVAAADAIYNVGSDVKAPDVLGSTYKETTEDGLFLGTWTMTGWDKDSAIVPNEEIVFVGKWVYKPETALVSYAFRSGTDGRELPLGLVNQAFTKEQNVGTNASIPSTIPTTYDEYKDSMKLGTWTLTGWDKHSAVVPNAGVSFTATWKFVPDTASVNYRYESGTEGRELPASLQPPASITYNVGTGVVPSVPETKHDEKHGSMTLGTWTLTGWDKHFALVPNEGVTFTATWEFIPATATVRYRYESGTEGRELPAEIVAASDVIYNVGSAVKAPDVLGDTYKETSEKGLFLGTWTMTGWNKSSAVVPNEGVVFVGKWVFKPETAPVSYKFTSGTEGRELPPELAKLMATVERNVGTDAGILDTIPTTYDEYKNGLKVGTWTLKGWDKTSDVVSNDGVAFNATWVYKQDDYSVTYRFVDKDGKDLPEDILKLLPTAATGLENGSTVKTPELKTKSVGRWSFKGWDIAEASVADKDVVVTGTWAYTPRYYYTTPQPELPKNLETPDTFDAGIAFYAVSGISSVMALGGIALLKKRKDDEN